MSKRPIWNIIFYHKSFLKHKEGEKHCFPPSSERHRQSYLAVLAASIAAS